ncbi:MAG: M48 family metalloprotease [Pyrinomonadaceae bacterium]
MYQLLGICLALAALLVVNACASLIAVLVWRAVSRRAQTWRASTRARVLFALRTWPALCALVCVAALLFPAYFLYEPRASTEIVTTKLALLATLSMLGLALAARRGFGAWYATRKLSIDWLRHAELLCLPTIDVPIYRIEHRFPVIAVVGAFRPRLFIATQISDALDADELRAALQHESGHLTARDNLKRALVRICSDALSIIPAGRTLDRAWAENAEAAADEYVVRTSGAKGALDLASALLKIARMVPNGARPTMPAGAFLMGENLDGVAWRVRRLTELAVEEKCGSEHSIASMLPAALWCSGGGLGALALLIVADSQLLIALHNLIERVVSALQ